MTPRERFDEKWSYDATTGCHLWTASTDQCGYGSFSYEGRTCSAHRWIWEETVGPIPDGLVVRHVTCANPSCVRIDHLRLGTHADNVADREEDGNTACGEQNGRAKLTAEAVREIRRRYEEEETTYGQLAEEYGVGDETTIGRIIRRETWAHLS